MKLPSIINHQSSIINHQSSIVNRQSSTLRLSVILALLWCTVPLLAQSWQIVSSGASNLQSSTSQVLNAQSPQGPTTYTFPATTYYFMVRVVSGSSIENPPNWYSLLTPLDPDVQGGMNIPAYTVDVPAYAMIVRYVTYDWQTTSETWEKHIGGGIYQTAQRDGTHKTNLDFYYSQLGG